MYEMYEEDAYIYIVTELCEGKELFQLILEDKVVSDVTVSHFQQWSDALGCDFGRDVIGLLVSHCCF